MQHSWAAYLKVETEKQTEDPKTDVERHGNDIKAGAERESGTVAGAYISG
jgi:hypothetical protein